MQDKAFDLGEEINSRKLTFKLYPDLWSDYLNKYQGIDLSINNWKTIKYLNTDGTDFNTDINLLPNDKGGLYLFTIGCEIIPPYTYYPVYIGRAQLTDNQNLRKRCREYFNKYKGKSERGKITRMFKYWSEYLYLSFMVLNSNKDIIEIEDELINTLLFPFNDQITNQKVRDAVKAFS